MEDTFIVSNNLSDAWFQAFQSVRSNTGNRVYGLSVTVRGDDLGEDENISRLLDSSLNTFNLSSIRTVANTIFPLSFYNPNHPREELYQKYIKFWGEIYKCKQNKYGTYFKRLISYGSKGKDIDLPTDINQLERIITTWNEKDNHRVSALQAAIWDPKSDHTDFKRGRGFPCMQQVCFTPYGSNGKDGLKITGIYAKQNIFEKAYGNYLGLLNLGNFVAEQMGLELKAVTCYANVADLKSESKVKMSHVDNLIEEIESSKEC